MKFPRFLRKYQEISYFWIKIAGFLFLPPFLLDACLLAFLGSDGSLVAGFSSTSPLGASQHSNELGHGGGGGRAIHTQGGQDYKVFRDKVNIC